jgi:tetratricopeptide (TPR) repeat protein
LGVCFGRVITANSPASQGENPANWEAVLWHEFCHVVTLHKTRNKMPRWLSEGISVYEEREADATWGQSMTPQYREIILSGKMTPVSRLSSAFLSPPSPLHLQFAYYESSLVVEYLIATYGMDALQNILTDLGEGSDINEALIRHTVPLGRLDSDFAKFARERAAALAPEGTWEKPKLPPGANSQALAKWLEEHPRSVPGLVRWSRQLLVERKFKEALAAAQQLKDVYPDGAEAESCYEIMAAAHRGLGDVAEERAALEELAARDSDAAPAYLRLMEIGEGQGDWESVARNARRMLAVNPLVAAPHRFLAQAAEKLGRREEAIRAYKALLLFDTTDAAETHFRLAQLLRDDGNRASAKRHALQALEEAPRFLAAHRLLLELSDPSPAGTGPGEGEAGAVPHPNPLATGEGVNSQ